MEYLYMVYFYKFKVNNLCLKFWGHMPPGSDIYVEGRRHNRDKTINIDMYNNIYYKNTILLIKDTMHCIFQYIVIAISQCKLPITCMHFIND